MRVEGDGKLRKGGQGRSFSSSRTAILQLPPLVTGNNSRHLAN